MNFCGIRRYNVQTNRVNQILISGKEVDLFIYSDKFRFHRKKDPLQDENSHLHSRSATCSPLNTIRRFLLFYFFHIYNLPKKKKERPPKLLVLQTPSQQPTPQISPQNTVSKSVSFHRFRATWWPLSYSSRIISNLWLIKADRITGLRGPLARKR